MWVVYLLSPYSPVAFYFFRPTKQNCLRGKKKKKRKLILIQTSTPDCLFLSGEAEVLDKE